MRVLDLQLLLCFTICMQVTLERLWVRQVPATRRNNALSLFKFLHVVRLLIFLWPPLFVSSMMVHHRSFIQLFILLLVSVVVQTYIYVVQTTDIFLKPYYTAGKVTRILWVGSTSPKPPNKNNLKESRTSRSYSRVIPKVWKKVRKTQHQNPKFGHTPSEILFFLNLQKSTIAHNRG